jgi:hypothetical protein
MEEEEELYKFMKIEKIKGSTNSASEIENYSHFLMMNNLMKVKHTGHLMVVN